jgi:hypothetical protein
VLARQQAALAALLECPYNNLKVFLDGALIYGGKAYVAVSTAVPAATNEAAGATSSAPSEAVAAAAAGASVTAVSTAEEASAEDEIAGAVAGQPARPAVQGSNSSSMDLQAAVSLGAGLAAVATGRDCADKNTQQQQQQQHQVCAGQVARSSAGAAEATNSSSSSSAMHQAMQQALDELAGSPTWASRRWNVAALLQQLDYFPQHQQQQGAAITAKAPAKAVNVEDINAAAAATTASNTAAEAAAALHDKELLLCRVLSGILNASGVLPKLLALQQRDSLDIEGIEVCYARLLNESQQQQQRQCSTLNNADVGECYQRLVSEAQQQQQQQRVDATGYRGVSIDSSWQITSARHCKQQPKQQQQQQQQHDGRQQQQCRSPADELLGHDQDSDSPQQQQQQQQQQQMALHSMALQQSITHGIGNPPQQQQQQQQHKASDISALLPACRQQQLTLVRDYLTAATAKDCAIMITLQQVVPQQQQQQQQQLSASCASDGQPVAADALGVPTQQQQQQQQSASSVSDAQPAAADACRTCTCAAGSMHWQHALAQLAAGNMQLATCTCAAGSSNSSSNSSSSRGSSASGKCSGVYADASSGCCFAWQLSLVDLDVKPLAKVPQHAALDRRVVAAALQHPGLLQQQLASYERWITLWLAQRQQQQQQVEL